MARPIEATIAVTFRCNSKCIMCNIWKEKDFQEILPEAYSKLPGSLKTINITGGEPFLRKDLVEVIRNIHKAAPKSRIVISTNGFLTDRTVEIVRQILKFHPILGVGVSIDGLGEMHDRIRGYPGGFEKAVATVKALKANGVTDLRLGMTIMPENSGQVMDVYKLAKDLGVEFTTTVAHNSGIYFKKTDNRPGEMSGELRADLGTIGDEHLRSFGVKNWFRAYHLAGLTDPAVRSGAADKCAAASRFFYMDPSGNIYPCIVMDKIFGNISKIDDFEAFFSSAEAESARKAVKRCREDCWMVCNIRSLIASHPKDSVVWIAKNKPRAHVSRSQR